MCNLFRSFRSLRLDQGMQHTDERLMLAVRDGDVGKLGLLFERHHQTLFSFFCRLTGNRAIAEDLVQDVFFRVLKYRKSFRDDSRFVTGQIISVDGGAGSHLPHVADIRAQQTAKEEAGG